MVALRVVGAPSFSQLRKYMLDDYMAIVEIMMQRMVSWH